MNGTLREMRDLARSGVDAIYLSAERYALLPQEVRERGPVVVDGVPVNRIIVEDPR